MAKSAAKKLSERGKEIAKKALRSEGFNAQLDPRLRKNANVSEGTLRRFWLRHSISEGMFDPICRELGIDPKTVADMTLVILETVKEVRENQKYRKNVYEHWGNIKMPDCLDPINLESVFTDTRLIDRSNGDTEIPNTGVLRTRLQTEDFTRVMILGKPGAGKTTLLRYLALQYLNDNIQVQSVPVFISLALFVADSTDCTLLKFITKQCVADGLEENNICTLIENGKLLILLDGLNEVSQSRIHSVITEIDNLIQSYRGNIFVISCRMSSYNDRFNNGIFYGFVNLEILEFTKKEIEVFANKWFYKKHLASWTEEFINYINSNDRVQDLATNPLLLTLLCLIISERISAEGEEVLENHSVFNNRSDIYGYALEMLLERWDASKQIHPIYQALEVRRLRDLLGQIAMSTFDKQYHSFGSAFIHKYVRDYIESLLNSENRHSLNIDAEEFLRFFESHGLLVRKLRGSDFSFSHPVFQEYLTARDIVFGISQNSLQKLVEKIFNKRWREVFLLTAEMLPEANELIGCMCIEINSLISRYEKSQKILEWIDQKANQIIHGYEAACVRATYIEAVFDQNFSCAFFLANPEKLPYDMKIDSYLGGVLFLAFWIGDKIEHLFPDNWLLGLGYGLDQAIDPNFARDISFQIGRGQVTDRQDIFLSCVSKINEDQVTKYSTEIFKILTILVDTVQEEALNEQLKFLRSRIPELSYNSEGDQLSWNQMEWCSWGEKLRNIMIKYRDIGHIWMLDQKEYEHLKHYYNANLLLIDCLNSNRRIPAEFRAGIIETLLLPATEQRALNKVILPDVE